MELGTKLPDDTGRINGDYFGSCAAGFEAPVMKCNISGKEFSLS